MLEENPHRYSFKTEYVSFIPLMRSKYKVVKASETKVLMRRFQSEINLTDMSVLPETFVHFRINLMSQKYHDDENFLKKIFSYQDFGELKLA
jgi:hypothetical protein